MARNERERDIDQLPWTRPGFVLAGLVVVLALLVGCTWPSEGEVTTPPPHPR